MTARPLTKQDLELRAIARAKPIPQHTNGTYWTLPQQQALREMYVDQEMTAGEVAAAMGCSRNAVSGQVHRMGLKR